MALQVHFYNGRPTHFRLKAMANQGIDTTSLICADIPLDPTKYPLHQLLSSFKEISALHPETRLLLAGRKVAGSEFSVQNFLEENHLSDKVDFYPYFNRCNDFPIKKRDAALWISRYADPRDITAQKLLADLSVPPKGEKLALFVTSFHPEKYEGNSTLMRMWLAHLRAAGYKVHLVWYMYDAKQVTDKMREAARRNVSRYVEVKVTTALVGKNRNGLNVHVDDWCGYEAIESVKDLCSHFEYDLAIVNYAFMSATFDEIPSYTTKILITHDCFANRNKNMLKAGYRESGWVSLTESGERRACNRADVVVALQEQEAEYFRQLTSFQRKVVTVSPTVAPSCGYKRTPAPKLKIGYLGSSNWVNEQNLGAFLDAWCRNPKLMNGAELSIAGGLDKDLLCKLVPNGLELLGRIEPRFLGPVENVQEYFQSCDLAVNPDRGGTGIKIKTLEAFASGVAVATTRAASIGFCSTHRFHLAENAGELAGLLSEVVESRLLLDEILGASRDVYSTYYAKNQKALDHLIGPSLEPDAAIGTSKLSQNRWSLPSMLRRLRVRRD